MYPGPLGVFKKLCKKMFVLMFRLLAVVYKLKTTPTPNKNASYAIKVEVHMPQKPEFVCHKSRFVHHILCESPFISRDFYAIRPLILWDILGAYFLLIWGVGLVKIVFM